MQGRRVGAGSHRFVEGVHVRRRPRSGFARRAALALASTTLATLALAASASATKETFNFIDPPFGAAQTWTVPAGVTKAKFNLYGAQGGGVTDGGPPLGPGLGGQAKATIAVTPGASIQVNVGGQADVYLAGFNGGGAGVATGPGGAGFGGGGASDIRIGGTDLDDRVLVAGGGGGAGGCADGGGGPNTANGGGGGGQSGVPGVDGCEPEAGQAPPGYTQTPGGGGTQTAGGSATSPATAGGLGVGGDGGQGYFAGGGGGGGWYGGGAGVAGGGGGSSYGPAGTVFQTGVRTGNGLVTVKYSVSLTCAGEAATIVGTDGSDTLRGTKGDDVIAAKGGGDSVTGLGGDDVVCGSGGNDEIRGNGGDDTLRGGRGNDDLRGGGGADHCRGAGGSDRKHQC